MKTSEAKKKFDQYAIEINKAIRSEPDEVTGRRNFNPVISEFMSSRCQMTVLTAFFEMACPFSIDMSSPLSKKLVAERMLSSCDDMLGLLKQHVEKLEEYLSTLKEETE